MGWDLDLVAMLEEVKGPVRLVASCYMRQLPITSISTYLLGRAELEIGNSNVRDDLPHELGARHFVPAHNTPT
jgi:hypothetical protein